MEQRRTVLVYQWQEADESSIQPSGEMTMSEQEVFEALKYRIEVDTRGTRRYYNNLGQLHRLDGPAVEYADGDKYWYQNDQFHRTNGPAIMLADGRKWWYLNDRPLTEAEFNQAVKLL